MRRAVLPALFLLLSVTAACGGSDLPDGLKVSGDLAKQPTVTIPGSSPGGDLAVTTLHQGKGPKIADGDLVVADYVGYRWHGKDHRLIASTYDSGHPAAFPYGRLVTGLNKAFAGQRPGSRVLAVIPPAQGYGANGYPQLQVGGSDSLVFVLDVRGAYHNTAAAHGDPQPQNDPRLPRVTTGGTPDLKIPATAPPAGLQVRTIIKGDGSPVQARKLVVFHDVAKIWRNGKIFESSRERGRPDSVIAGAGQMLAGWDRAVVGQPVGSRVLVVMPPKFAYGAKGHSASGIMPGDTLAFVIDILAAH